MNTPRLFIYEVRKRTGPVTHEFHSYAIYSSKTHQVIHYFKGETQRAARRLCDEYLSGIIYADELPIIVWRNWPLLMWPDELTEQKIVEKIRGREVMS